MINTNVRSGGHIAALMGSGSAEAGAPMDSTARPDMRSGEAGSGDTQISEAHVSSAKRRKTVVVCDTQPVTAEGIRTVLAENPDLQFQQVADSLNSALDLARRVMPDVIVVDKTFGIQAILEWLNEIRLVAPGIGVVIWGVSVTEAEALRFLQAGARGILRKTAVVSVVLSCLRTVAEKRSWMEDSVFRDSARSDRYPRSELTAREQQVLELVEQGFKNKEIAVDLGIRPGTVKIHLKHIFEKTGVRGRYGLALSGLKERGAASLPA
jgi:two-component system nitrate/nitrite response regulator NarL